ncbi:MAG TPA: tetratricopeptide repeat protein [Gemmatales bacterium]|nr:tetratricopeptide repeat protein [Gemmatales bacterium]HMP60494.1 tetratricopeptide repeat protein [Gemmatales bacterium]
MGRWVWIAVALFIIMAMVMPALATPPRSVEPYLERAEVHLRSRRWTAAESSLNQAHLLAPNDPQVLAAQARLAWRQEQVARSQTILAQALRADRHGSAALLLRSEIRQEQGDANGAIDDLRLVLLREAQHPEAHLRRARLLARQDRHAEAIADASRHLQIQPNALEALELRARAYERIESLDDAVADWSTVVRLAPNPMEALLARAKIYERLGKSEAAISDYTAALDIDAKMLNVVLARGQLYAQMGKHQQAIADLSRYLEKNPNSEQALAQRGRSYARLLQWQKALDDFQAVLKESPFRAETLQDAALALDHLDRVEDALAMLKKIIDRDPSAYVAHIIKVRVLHRVDRNDEALADLDFILRLVPDYFLALQQRAVIFLHLNRPAEALDDLDKCIQELGAAVAAGESTYAPFVAAVLQYRAGAYRRLGRADEALRDLDEAVRLAPRETHSYTQRGFFLQSKGKWEAALADYARILSLPDDQETATTRGYAELLIRFLNQDYEGGRQLARKFAQEQAHDANWLYDVACALAIGADLAARREQGTEATKLATRLRNDALDVLEAAVAQGYNDWPHLRYDQDFSALRDEPRFQHLCRPRNVKPATP